MSKEINQKSPENSVNSATGSRISLKNGDFQANHSQNQGKSFENSQNSDQTRKNAENSRNLTESEVNSSKFTENKESASNSSKSIENSINSDNSKENREFEELLSKNGDNSNNLSQNTTNSANSKENAIKSSNPSENAVESMDFKLNNENSAQVKENIENSASIDEIIENSADIGKNAENNVDMGEGGENSSVSVAKATSLKDFFNIDSENELKSQFPSVNIENLRNNKDFNELLRLIIQNPTLAQVYSCFNAIVSSTEEHSRKKLAYALASANSSVGSLSSSSKTEQAYFTKEQVLNMSQEEIRRNYTKIRQSQQHW